MKRWWMMIVVILIPIVFFSILSCSATRPTNLGINNGKLAPCPSSPNCVSSQSQDEDHRTEPIVYSSSMELARNRMVSVIETLPRTKIIKMEGNYVYTEFTSMMFRFVDDVEMYFDDEAKKIEIRSASRSGYSDLGVNRKRIEQIRNAFKALDKPE